MGAYKKCPRCDLNWIKQDEDYCPVCKAELKLKGGLRLIEEDEELEEERICPICKVNPLADDEEICAQCAAEKATGSSVVAEAKETPLDDDESWKEYVDDDDSINNAESLDDDEISLSDLEDEEDEDEENSDIDDFEDFSDDIGDADYEDDDEEDEFNEDDEV